jgi:hypothetical protein
MGEYNRQMADANQYGFVSLANGVNGIQLTLANGMNGMQDLADGMNGIQTVLKDILAIRR